MNQGMYDLMLAELRESRRQWDAKVAEYARELQAIIMGGNGTLREPSEFIERKFRDSL